MGRRALVLVIALVLAGVAAFSIFQYLQGVEDQVLQNQEAIPVYRAVAAIPEGTEGNFILQGGEGALFRLDEEQREDLPGGAITTEEELRAVLGGRVAAGPISENQILSANQWVQLTVEITPLAELIPEGKQAITVAPSNVQGVNGFVQPGDRVNVIVTLDIEFQFTALADDAPDFGIPVDDTGAGDAAAEESLTTTYTRFVLQGLPVLAVDQEIRPDPEADVTGSIDAGQESAQEGTVQEEGEQVISTVFTLEVTPEEAEKLVFAQTQGLLYYTLVPPDFVEVDTRGVTIETLFEGDLVEDIFGDGN